MWVMFTLEMRGAAQRVLGVGGRLIADSYALCESFASVRRKGFGRRKNVSESLSVRLIVTSEASAMI